MDIDKVFQDQLIKITQEAAISVYPHLGKNNKINAQYFYFFLKKAWLTG